MLTIKHGILGILALKLVANIVVIITIFTTENIVADLILYWTACAILPPSILWLCSLYNHKYTSTLYPEVCMFILGVIGMVVSANATQIGQSWSMWFASALMLLISIGDLYIISGFGKS